MSKHTPGPWHHTGREFNDVRDSDDELVAVALHLRVGQPQRSVQEAEANARLIAAAPELLEALQQALEFVDGWKELSWCAPARAAIAKATGSDHQPYKVISDHMIQATNGRVQIDPVTGNVGIGIVPAAIAKATGESA